MGKSRKPLSAIRMRAILEPTVFPLFQVGSLMRSSRRTGHENDTTPGSITTHR
ncbi:hypothetical protein CANTEDRAFT_112251 [Yamadazyma tenuis ATCC 10573]|uniref:Uncharacterized protein n=1 Tax=Candida tenuis (strain ATCC 10573 / BCRC 21748 / CBS 615 / JCM 9827 / NBRC 10315 / NRRL Y-1498 / VKM Y-70) TaxID=590646 RepID=G3AWF9_CANTC|nr:uncharacterized protein CANTEDRAFT_112251 [Yamadazyma tenuis ATCC 10573]EGV66529.1 hypothetical protein CANTEDRAFT_112251 [Yamadazyma tenuis ATCC 10573]